MSYYTSISEVLEELEQIQDFVNELDDNLSSFGNEELETVIAETWELVRKTIYNLELLSVWEL